MVDWKRWIGLPHMFGVHPESGQGCDCVLMVWAILDSIGVHHPPFDERWLLMGADGHWDELRQLWESKTQKLDKPQEHAVTLFENGPAGLGVGIVVDNGALIVHHTRGVCWVPFRVLRGAQFCMFT